jgi:hypothetical protein
MTRRGDPAAGFRPLDVRMRVFMLSGLLGRQQMSARSEMSVREDMTPGLRLL